MKKMESYHQNQKWRIHYPLMITITFLNFKIFQLYLLIFSLFYIEIIE